MDRATAVDQSVSEHVGTVQVSAYYPSAAREKTFEAELEQTLRHVVEVAYQKLEEQPRPGDMILCHSGTPRTDLAPYLDQTLAHLAQTDICVHARAHHGYALAIDIDAEAGGA